MPEGKVASAEVAAPTIVASAAPDSLNPEILRQRHFGEAPILAQQVAAGKLPPVRERLPEDPLVVRPIERIGNYGGTLRREISSEFLDWQALNQTLTENLLGFRRPVAEVIEPNLAASYTFEPDGKSAVFRLRKGVKWSDGMPFTVDDILFWYYDTVLDADARVFGVGASDWTLEGQPLRLEKQDDITLKISADHPMGMLLRRLCHYVFVLPKHTFAPFHPRYNSNATYADFKRRTSLVEQVMSPGVPRLSAWIPVQRVTGQRIVYERNPYYWKIDTAGNQLPYADRMTVEVISDPQVSLLKFTNGEFDLIGRNMEASAIPTLYAQMKTGRYQLHTRNPEPGPALYLNWDVADRALRAAFHDVRVRRALSLAINRKEISEIVYHGLLTPGGFAFGPTSAYYSADDFKRNTDYDPVQARALLEAAGFRDRDGDGFLEFTDGRRFAVTLDLRLTGGLGDVAELVRDYWRAVGIFVYLNPGREEIIYSRRQTGQFQVYLNSPMSAAEEPRNSPFMWSIVKGSNLPFWYRSAEIEAPAWLQSATDFMRQANATVDLAKIRASLMGLQRVYVEEVPAIGIGALAMPWAANVRLGNVPETGTFSSAFSGWSRNIFLEQVFVRSEPRP